MRRLILLAGLALAALPQTAEAHGGWERRGWERHGWERHRDFRRYERRREHAWRREEWRRRQAYGYGSPVAYAQPGLTVTIPFR